MTDTQRISELIPDAHNARKHNRRNINMIADALNEVGPARSIVIDEDNNILAGNGTWEAATQAGIEHVQIIESDPTAITAVRIRGLSERDKRRLSLYDNRAAELAEWEPSVLSAWQPDTASEENGDLLVGIFREDEVAFILGEPPEVNTAEMWTGMPEYEQQDLMAKKSLTVNFATLEDYEAFAELIGQAITERTRFIWFPEKPARGSVHDAGFVDEA